MERFGELRLLSSTKHIEIERPATVSPQHVIALEFDLYVLALFIARIASARDNVVLPPAGRMKPPFEWIFPSTSAMKRHRRRNPFVWPLSCLLSLSSIAQRIRGLKISLRHRATLMTPFVCCR